MEGVALLRTAEQHLHTVQLCIDHLSTLEACAALRTLALRLQELSFRAGGTSDASAMAERQAIGATGEVKKGAASHHDDAGRTGPATGNPRHTRFGVLEQNSGAESQILHRRCSD
jgi:hypothetical protein